MIELKEVSLEYQNGTLALKDINLHIGQGELVYIAGPSGSGKTSLLKLLMGMENPTAGTVTVLGKSLTNAKPRKISRIRRKIGPVFQDLKLIPGRSALENVLMGVRFLNFSWAKKNENALIAIERVGLSHKAYSMVENLSLGELRVVLQELSRGPSNQWRALPALTMIMPLISSIFYPPLRPKHNGNCSNSCYPTI